MGRSFDTTTRWPRESIGTAKPSQARGAAVNVPLSSVKGDNRQPLQSDVVSAVRAVFPAEDVDGVLGWLERVDSDRLAVAILVQATLERPDAAKIRQGVEQSTIDVRDVLMTEYDERIDYPAALKRLGLVRPYPV